MPKMNAPATWTTPSIEGRLMPTGRGYVIANGIVTVNQADVVALLSLGFSLVLDSVLSSAYDGDGSVPPYAAAPGFAVTTNHGETGTSFTGDVSFWNTNTNVATGDQLSYTFNQVLADGTAYTIAAMFGDGTYSEIDILNGLGRFGVASDGIVYMAADAGAAITDTLGNPIIEFSSTNFITTLAGAVNTFTSTFSDLPGTPVKGMVLTVTDSNASALGSAVTGTGSHSVLTWYNGTAWTIIGI